MFRKIIFMLLIGLFVASSALAAETKNPTAVIETSLGNVKVELFEKEAPISVKNFLDYAKSGHYNGTIFHRVIPGFMIQGGGITTAMTPKETKAPIKNEAANGLKNERGTLAMARTMVVDSATSQFFINVAKNDFLNHKPGGPQSYGYAVFGKVIEGMDVVDKIREVKTGNKGGHQDVPVEPVFINSVKIVEE
jgi:peptidyl-prolyl cis-trans isomerase A (cyclophilin A)